jgi:urease accessory protein
MKNRRLVAIAAVASAVLAMPKAADAHLMNTSFGPFYNGLVHPFVTPEDLLPVIALALIAGLSGARCGRIAIFTLPTAWVAGSVAGAAGLLLASQGSASWTTAIATMALGSLVALGRSLPWSAVAGLALALGATNGGFNGAELARSGASLLVTVGVAVALFVLMAVVAGQVTSVRAPGARVAVRVAGSWIVAIGMFMWGWSMRGV